MPERPFCFVIMPFKPELNFFFLYIQHYLKDKFQIHVERGDHNILTKPIMEKILDQITESDIVIADITGGNPNVFYELGIAHSIGKPVIFLTQDDPSEAPVDVRPFEYIKYNLDNHKDLLSKLDNAIQNIFVEDYKLMYDEALEILNRFNKEMKTNFVAASLDDFQLKVRSGVQTDSIPPEEDQNERIAFLLPKILEDPANIDVMKKVTTWLTDIE